MMFYAGHFMFCDFICKNVSCTIDLHRVTVDDLPTDGPRQIDAQLALADARATY